MKQSLQAEKISGNDFAVVIVSNENSVFSNLSKSLAEIRKSKGVKGYILRSNSSALVDFGENRLSVFLEKQEPPAWIIKRIITQT